MQIDRIAQVCQRLLKAFEDGSLPPAVARTVIKRKSYDKPSDKWSLGNQIIMVLSGTNDARGYRQWEEVGRHVKKGAKAFYILAPIYKTRKVKETSKNENGESVEEIEREVTTLVSFKDVPVFRYEDTEGKSIPIADYTPKVLPPLVNVAEKLGVRITYTPFVDRFYGYFRSDTKDIVLCSHDVKVFFHELAHAAHNTIRPLKGGQHANQEIVAEMVAAVLCEVYGFTGYHWHAYEYIRSYAKAHDGAGVIKAVMHVFAEVQRVLEVILLQDQETAEKVA